MIQAEFFLYASYIGCSFFLSMLRVWMKPDGIVEKRSRKGLIRMGSKQAENFKLSLAQFYGIPMAIVGSLQSGLTGDHQMLFTKSMLDFVSSMIFASSLGLGVLFAAGFVLVFQGGITLLAGLAAPFLGDAVIAEMTCVGSVLIIGLGLNMLGLTKLKVMNYLPAIFLPILLCLLW